MAEFKGMMLVTSSIPELKRFGSLDHLGGEQRPPPLAGQW